VRNYWFDKFSERYVGFGTEGIVHGGQQKLDEGNLVCCRCSFSRSVASTSYRLVSEYNVFTELLELVISITR
jgi:hypothetical protein